MLKYMSNNMSLMQVGKGKRKTGAPARKKKRTL